LQPASDKLNLTVSMLGQQWYETAAFQAIPPNSWRVDIDVRPTSFKKQSVLHLTGYFSKDRDKRKNT
jgi:hypothetical protein